MSRSAMTDAQSSQSSSIQGLSVRGSSCAAWFWKKSFCWQPIDSTLENLVLCGRMGGGCCLGGYF